MIFRQLGILGLCAVLLTGCDSSPTEPQAPAGTQEPAAAQDKLTIEPIGDDPLRVGARADLDIRSPIASVEVGISTDLGHFGLDGGGNPIRIASVWIKANRRGQIPFFAGDTAGTANIVANLGADTEHLQVTITADPLLFLLSVEPKFGDPAGGDEVTLRGQGFSTDPARPMRVTFGDALAKIVNDSVTSEECTVVTPQSKVPVPVGQTLVVDITVTIAATDTQEEMADILEGAFTYAHGDDPVGPAVYYVVPATGSNLGGYEVTLNGTGFAKSVYSVYVAFGFGATPGEFNGSEAVVIRVDDKDGTWITVETPRARPSMLNQTVDVLVRNHDTGLATVAPAIFTYVEQGLVSDIQPRNASYTGTFNADAVIITGQGFVAEDFLTIEFGGVVQPGGAVVAGTEIHYGTIEAVAVQDCAPPSGPVIISNRVTGETAQSRAIFSYVAESPSLLAINPPEVPEAGGIRVTLTGVFSDQELLAASLLVNGANALFTGDESAIDFTAPAYTGSFAEVPCANGAGLQYAPAAVDVELIYLETGCRDRVAGLLSYLPADASCRIQEAPVPSFVFGPAPNDALTIQFTNTTPNATKVDTWRWLFGDGASANDQEPGAHIYAAAGTYTVILQATNTVGTGSVSQVVTVPLPGTVPDPPIAGFTFSVDHATRTVFFTDTSTNDPTSWEWFFGDGRTGGDQHPTHVYARAGSFTVTLRATNAGGTGSFSQEVTIPDPPVASFSFSIDPSNNLTVIFVDTSTGSPTSWTWLFGDGTTSNAQHPTHGYAAAGTYTVTLQATNADGTDSFTQPITVGP